MGQSLREELMPSYFFFSLCIGTFDYIADIFENYWPEVVLLLMAAHLEALTGCSLTAAYTRLNLAFLPSRRPEPKIFMTQGKIGIIGGVFNRHSPSGLPFDGRVA